MVVISTIIGLLGAEVYSREKTKRLQETIALEIVLAANRFQKELAEQSSLTPKRVRSALGFLSVFPYVKCAELKVVDNARGAWPIPICKPILKKFDTRAVTTVINDQQTLIFHIDRNYIKDAIKTERLTFLLIISVMLITLALAMIIFMVMQVTRPFRKIASGLGFDDDGVVTPVEKVGGREFQSFITAYNNLVADVIVKTKEVTTWRARIRNELDQADAVQALLVPQHLSQPGIDAYAIPLRELSGDFHEIFTHEDGRRTMILGDVAGKGIYAAMMLAQTLTAFRASVHHNHLTDVLVELNTLIEDRFPDGLFVALTLVRIASDGMTAELLVTGNPDAVWIGHDGSVTTYGSVGPAIGVLPPMIYSAQTPADIDLKNGTLFMFSDGISDLVIGADGQGFSNDEELKQYLVELETSHGSAALAVLMENVSRFEQVDDVTITRISSVN